MMAALAFGLGCIALLLAVRNLVTYRATGAALERVFSDKPGWLARLAVYERVSYNAFLFDLRLWTARQAWPELFEEEERV